MAWTQEQLDSWHSRFPPDAVYAGRLATIRAQGLRCRLWPETLQGGLCAVRLEPLPGWVRLATVDPESPFHVSLCFAQELDDDRRRDWAELTTTLAGRDVTLVVSWFGSGGTAYLDEGLCPLASLPVVQRLHQHGWYSKRGLHVSL